MRRLTGFDNENLRRRIKETYGNQGGFCVLKGQLKSEFNGEVYLQTKHYKIERTEAQEDINYLMQKGSEFWQYVRTRKQPALVLPEI